MDTQDTTVRSQTYPPPREGCCTLGPQHTQHWTKGKRQGQAGDDTANPTCQSAWTTGFLFPLALSLLIAGSMRQQQRDCWRNISRPAPAAPRGPIRSPALIRGAANISQRSSAPNLPSYWHVRIHFLNGRFGLSDIPSPKSRFCSSSGPIN